MAYDLGMKFEDEKSQFFIEELIKEGWLPMKAKLYVYWLCLFSYEKLKGRWRRHLKKKGK